MTVYKGVPFAAPPVGDLRWKAPQPVIPWEGVRQAKDYDACPMQSGNNPYGYSEDCLYLNIWTPAKSPKDKLPVMVWIYGGGFAGGATADPVMDGSELARKGVIMISTAYRVGKIGFLAHPELSAEDPHGVSGNYGLLDQIAALRWIQNNISAFGGDPGRVTIFGESAGGISVSMLCASPLAAGLFSGAISESGGSFGPTRPTTAPGENMKTLRAAEADGIRIAEGLGAQSLAELRALDASRLIERQFLPRTGSRTAPQLHRIALRPLGRTPARRLPHRRRQGRQTGARPDARCGLRLAHLELGPPAGQARRLERLPLLF